MLETTVWAKYRNQGFLLVAVLVGDNARYGAAVAQSKMLTFPEVLDLEGTAFPAYQQLDGVTPPFPLNYLIGKDGAVRYIHTNDGLDIPTLDAQIAAALAQ